MPFRLSVFFQPAEPGMDSQPEMGPRACRINEYRLAKSFKLVVLFLQPASLIRTSCQQVRHMHTCSVGISRVELERGRVLDDAS
jgi:hypothetical protein